MGTEVFTGDVILDFEKVKIYRTLTTPFESGKEQRRSKWTRPKHQFKWGCRGRNEDHADYVYNFFNSMQGKGDSFYWEVTDESPTSQSGDEHVGTGDGTTKTFYLDRYPVISGDCNLTVGGIAKTEAVDYDVNYTTGALTFGTAPTSGDIITATSYRFYYNVRFLEDELSRQNFAYKLYNFDISLVEVL